MEWAVHNDGSFQGPVAKPGGGRRAGVGSAPGAEQPPGGSQVTAHGGGGVEARNGSQRACSRRRGRGGRSACPLRRPFGRPPQGGAGPLPLPAHPLVEPVIRLGRRAVGSTTGAWSNTYARAAGARGGTSPAGRAPSRCWPASSTPAAKVATPLGGLSARCYANAAKAHPLQCSRNAIYFPLGGHELYPDGIPGGFLQRAGDLSPPFPAQYPTLHCTLTYRRPNAARPI